MMGCAWHQLEGLLAGFCYQWTYLSHKLLAKTELHVSSAFRTAADGCRKPPWYQKD